MNELRKYSVKELASILGCSATAVQKKIKPDENNPEIKRYKKRYNTVVNDGKLFILLSDDDIEEEKRLSKGFNNVVRNVIDDTENVIDIEAEPETQTNSDYALDKIIEFTNVHIQRYETLHETYYKELIEKDKQLNLLTTTQLQKDAENKQAQAKSKELEKRNRLLTLYLTVVTTLFITLVGLFITFYINVNNVVNAETEKPSEQAVTTVENVNNEITPSNNQLTTNSSNLKKTPAKRHKKPLQNNL